MKQRSPAPTTPASATSCDGAVRLSLRRNDSPSASFPPFQHAQRSERVPATRRPPGFQLEVGLPPVRVLQRPTTAGASTAADDVDRLGQPSITRRVNRLEVVERTKNVVVPPRRKGEAY